MMMMISSVFISALVFAAVLISSTTQVSHARNIDAGLEVPWPKYSHSFIAEVSEFINHYSPSSFWKFVDSMCSTSSVGTLDGGSADSEDDRLHSSLSDSIQLLVPSNLRSLMETFVNMGGYAPGVRFHNTLTEKYGDPCNGKAYVVALGKNSEGGIELEEDEDDTEESEEDIRIICDLEESNFPSSSSNSSATMGNNIDFKWEHVHNKHSTSESRFALHGIIGSSSFCSLHHKLSALSDKGDILYFVRHAFPGQLPVANNTYLQGYGVFLDIKNMEYKTIDDSKKSLDSDSSGGGSESSSSSPTVSFPADESVAGVVFSKIYDRRPTLGAELNILRDRLYSEIVDIESSGSDDKDMKIWRMKDLGLQTLLSVNKASNPLKQLTDIVQNFPSQAKTLSSMKISSEFREKVTEFYNSDLLRMLNPNGVYINGVRFDFGSNTFNVYDLLNEIRIELEKMNKLDVIFSNILTRNKLNIDPKVLSTIRSKVRSIAMSGKGGGEASSIFNSNPQLKGYMASATRIDVSKGGKYVVNFVNNLEKDAMYKRWPKSLKQLMYPSWSLQTIAKNMFTVIININPLDREAANTFLQMMGMYEQQYPIRFGFVFDCTDLEAATGDYARSGNVCNLFEHLRENHSTGAAIDFMTKIAEAIVQQDEMGDPSMSAQVVNNAPVQLSKKALVGHFTEAATSTATKVKDVAKLSSKEWKKIGEEVYLRPAGDFARNCTQYLQNRGLKVPSMSLNGIVFDGAQMNTLYQYLGNEQAVATHLFVEGVIDDKTKSIFNSFLAVSNAYPRYHPIIDEKSPTYIDIMSLLDQSSSNSNSKKNSLFLSNTMTDLGANGDTPRILNTTVVYVRLNSIYSLDNIKTVLTWLYSESSIDTSRLKFIFDSGSENEGQVDSSSSSCANRNQQFVNDMLLLTFSQACDRSDSICDIKVANDLLTTIDLLKNFTVEARSTFIDGLKAIEHSALEQELVRYLSCQQASMGDDQTCGGGVGGASKCLPSGLAASYESMSSSFAILLKNTQAATTAATPFEDSVVVVFNGRVMRTSKDQQLHELDIDLLSSLESSRMGGNSLITAISSSIADSGSTIRLESDDLLRLCGFVGTYGVSSTSMKVSSRRIDAVGYLKDSGLLDFSKGAITKEHPTVLFFDDGEQVGSDVMIKDAIDSMGLQIAVVFDPLTLGGQRATAILSLLASHLKYPVLAILLPSLDIGSNFPLQSFYRYVLSPSSPSAKAAFRVLPKKHVFTVRMDVPEPWNVQATSAQQDIDNLVCDESQCGDTGSQFKDLTSVTYTLKNILVAGQCFEKTAQNMRPPNGLQLTLTPTSNSGSDASGTVVMQNLGYFQLQANPGLWKLELAAGRPRELFALEGTATSGGRGSFFIPIRSFCDVIQRIYVSKHKGREAESLLEDVETVFNSKGRGGGSSSSGKSAKKSSSKKDKNKKDTTVWNSITGFFGGSGEGVDDKKLAVVPSAGSQGGHPDDDKIHVFSLATGHVYERLLRIMMLSVSRRTSKPVKFWLLENYLSPTFKKIASIMAAKYNFEVAYVTYKWPEWLTQQTQKQRIIWGYKILFLDVLFPLHLKKIIYVDSDQVIRSDLNELWEMSLEGHPYAYTPFCDSREETLGFQFWRQGYWSDHLRGKPYHISALYVVDLQVFRKLTVGDQLRSIYDGLAKDPNSLSNLDQDLPNYAQHAVPIFSLPQEWLWCETWCSDSTKKKAKTIDLCNSPLHKEPKLAMARRIINGSLFPESWVELDEEIRSTAKTDGYVI